MRLHFEPPFLGLASFKDYGMWPVLDLRFAMLSLLSRLA
jgi:hypothetical protein